MWGIGGGHVIEKGTQRRRLSVNSEDHITPDWEKKHPVWVFAISGIQYIVFCILIYFVFIPDIQYSQSVAILRSIEQTSFGSSSIDCSSSNNVCSQASLINLARRSDASVWEEIETIGEIFGWLYNVVAVIWQGAFFGNFNQVYMLELILARTGVKEEQSVQYKNFLNKNLGVPPWSSKELYQQTFFRTFPEDANFRDTVTKLRDNDGWFDDATTSIDVVFKLFNGFIGSWVTIKYGFSQTSSGGFVKTSQLTAIHPFRTDNVFLVPQLIFSYCVILTVFYEIIREILLIFQLFRYRPPSLSVPQVSKAKFNNIISHYIQYRLLPLCVKITKLFFIILLCCRLFHYMFNGPQTVLQASLQRNGKIVESSIPFVSQVAFTVTAALVLILMAMNLLLQLKNIHPDLDVVVYTVTTFFTVFYGCFVIFFLLWCCWSIANHLILGSEFDGFSRLEVAFPLTFKFFFGEPTQGYLKENDSNVTTNWVILLIVMLMTCHIVVLPVCVAAVTCFYAFRETKRLAESSDEATGLWIQRKCLKGCQRRCFCFSPDPMIFYKQQQTDSETTLNTQVSSKDTKLNINSELISFETSRGSDKKSLAVSTATDIVSYWEKRLFFIYIIFLALFIIGVIQMLDITNQFNQNAIAREIAISSSFIEQYKVPPLPYDSVTPLLPDREKNIVDQINISGRNVSGLINISTIEDWIRDVIILRLMNPNFYVDRHSVPLSNPFTIVFLTSNTFDNLDPFTVPLWPTSTDSSPIISPTSLQEDVTNSLQGAVTSDLDKNNNDGLPTYVKLRTSSSSPPDVYVLQIYFGDPETAVKQLAVVMKSIDILEFRTRYAIIRWGEYNGDARLFALHSLQIQVKTTGEMSTVFSTSGFQESSDEDAYINPEESVINLFPNSSLEIFFVSILFLFIYTISVIWLAFQGHWRLSFYKSVMDLILLGSCLFMLVAMSGTLTPLFQPLWRDSEIPDDDGSPFPRANEIPGPAVLHPIASGGLRGLSVFQPNKERSSRIILQLQTLKLHRDTITGFAICVVMLGLIRLPLFASAFPNTIISHIPIILYSVRWKLYLVVIILAMIGVAQLAVGFLTLGLQNNNFATFRSSWISGWLLSSAKWNYRYFDAATRFTGRWSVLFQVASVLLWVLVFHNILAVLLYGLRRSKSQSRERLKIELYQTWNLRVREKLTIRCNQKVLLYWRAVVKALQIKKRQLDTDGEFARQIDGFFLRFRTSPVFRQAPADAEECLKRSILAHNLTRIQTYISDIILIRCKKHLVAEDAANAKELTHNLSQTSQGKTRYIKTLKKKLERLKEQLSVIQDTIDFHKTDFRPDVTQVSARGSNEEGRYIDDKQTERQRKQLEAKRAERAKKLKQGKKRREKNSETEMLLAEAEEGSENDGNEQSSSHRDREEPTTPFQFIDLKEKHRPSSSQRRGRTQVSSSEDDNDWQASRAAITRAKKGRETQEETSKSPISSPTQAEKSEERRKHRKHKKKRKETNSPDRRQATDEPTDIFAFSLE